MGIEIVSVEVMQKTDKETLGEAEIRFRYDHKDQVIPCHYTKCKKTGNVTLCPDEAETDWPHDHPIMLILKDHDGSRESEYPGQFNEDGHFVPQSA